MSKNYIVENYELDDHQMQLLLHDANSLVIAGAGSGKTLTILGKVNYLIEQKNINPSNILLISFTNASVNDIKNRIKYNVNVFTFHKLAMHILKENKINYTICNTKLLSYTVKEYLKCCPSKEQAIILKFLRLNITYKKFLYSKEFINFCNLIETFINLYKTNNFNYEDILATSYKITEKNILLIIFKIYQNYIIEKNSINAFDFDDLIIYATKQVKNKKLGYKYLIIDEFQDTSLIRLNLIKEIFLAENAKIIVVGDDWQSIYHFSGCNLDVFLNFHKLFPDVKKINLVNTYRNSQQLIDVASKFVMKNPHQINKNLISPKCNHTPIILSPYTNKVFSLKKILNYILKFENNILILSRNNNDIYDYIDNEFSFDGNILIYKNTKIEYLTIHRSKGLEANYIIVLNCNNNMMGIPNKIENNKIIEKLFPNEKFPYAEERRLFYVAITRCKEQTFLLYDKNSPSIFIKEIKSYIKKTTKKVHYFK